MSAVAECARKVWTEAEIEPLPGDACLHEVVNCERVMSPKNNFQHENVFSRLCLALAEFNREHRLGVVRGSSAGLLKDWGWE